MLLVDFDTLDFDTTPSEESCVQVSRTEEYLPAMRREARIMREQLRRQFGEEPEDTSILIKFNPHDFGTYLSIVVRYNPGDETSREYAYKIDSNWPEKWDEIALRELKA